MALLLRRQYASLWDKYSSIFNFRFQYSNYFCHVICAEKEDKAFSKFKLFLLCYICRQSRVIDTPGGVACSPSGYLYLVDSCEQRILRFDRTGKLRKVVLSQEDGLEWPISVACVDDSTLCVAEFYGQVKVFRVR